MQFPCRILSSCFVQHFRQNTIHKITRNVTKYFVLVRVMRVDRYFPSDSKSQRGISAKIFKTLAQLLRADAFATNPKSTHAAIEVTAIHAHQLRRTRYISLRLLELSLNELAVIGVCRLLE
jgi:predicted small integral membrane protein